MSGISHKPLLQEKGFCHSTPCLSVYLPSSFNVSRSSRASHCRGVSPPTRQPPRKERRQAGGRAQVCALPASNSEHLIVPKAPGLVECGDSGAGEPGGGDNTCSVQRHAQEREVAAFPLESHTPCVELSQQQLLEGKGAQMLGK